MFDIEENELLRKHMDTLKNISKDSSHNEYMTESDISVVNFDKVKTDYANFLGLSEEVAKSIDSLGVVTSSSILTFIEFKNGKMKNEKNAIRHKVKDSLLILCDITGKNISEFRRYLEFILVYNQERNDNIIRNSEIGKIGDTPPSLIDIHKRLMAKGGAESILFGLEKFKTLYFNEVHTFNEQEFNKYLEL